MPKQSGRLLRRLFAWNHGPDVELVGIGNFLVSCAASIALYVALKPPLLLCVLAAIACFLLLTLSLLSRRTFWISALLGGLVLAVVPAVLLAGLGELLLGDGGCGFWIGAALGTAIGLATAFSAYRAVLRSTHREP